MQPLHTGYHFVKTGSGIQIRHSKETGTLKEAKQLLSNRGEIKNLKKPKGLLVQQLGAM
jgi:hypothetical protein